MFPFLDRLVTFFLPHRTPQPTQSTEPPSAASPCIAQRYTYDPQWDFTRRVGLDSSYNNIFSYPSTGGIIVLEDASPADFDFLDLVRMYPPDKRHAAPEEEDKFCEQMLLLEAKWFDSPSRYSLFLGGPDEWNDEPIESGNEPLPSQR